MLNKFRKTQKGFSLVELMIVVAILGVLAAIAIPAFVRYLNASKAAEATGILSRMSAGAKAYFEGDQQYAPSEPWHTGGTQGYPVPGSDKVFPGGATNFATHANVPYGGSKAVPDGTIPTELLNKLRVEISGPLYFNYTYESANTGNSSTLALTACHGFKATAAPTDCNGIHAVKGSCSVAGGVVECAPFFTENEFE